MRYNFKNIIITLLLIFIYPFSAYAHFSIEKAQETSLDKPILIYTEQDLRKIGNDKEWALDKHYKLMNDILFEDNENNWIPIGNRKQPFTGVFDGNFHSVFGIKIIDAFEEVAFIGNIGATGIVKNLELVNLEILLNQGIPIFVGSLAAFNNGAILNCKVTDAKIIINTKSDISIGGAVGVNEGEIVSSQISVTICGNNFLRGEIGGVVGRNYGLIEKCSADVDIKASGRVGGIAGVNFNSISRCFSAGNIATSHSSHDVDLGGIAGEISFTLSNDAKPLTDNVTILNCYSMIDIEIGSFRAPEYCSIGGILGECSSPNALIKNCYYTGNIICKAWPSKVGGIVGFGSYLLVESCFLLSTYISFDTYTGGYFNESYFSWVGINKIWDSITSSLAPIIFKNIFIWEKTYVTENSMPISFPINEEFITVKNATELSLQSTYEEAGWNFSQDDPIWEFNKKHKLPQLVGLKEQENLVHYIF